MDHETSAHDPRRTTVTVRGIELGRGRPEIIVPLVGEDREALLEQAAAALETPARILEWRLDRFLPEVTDPEEHRELVLDALPQLRSRLGPDRALLVTFRTTAEGGRRALGDRDLGRLLHALISGRRTGHVSAVDLVDVETARDRRLVEGVIEAARRHGIAVVGSHHDLEGTPDEAEMVRILREQRRLGADIAKLAVTPHSARDVLALLGASLTVAEDRSGPHIAVSMGTLGTVSRAAAETFGGSATFAQVGEGSAPGQLEVSDAVRLVELLRP